MTMSKCIDIRTGEKYMLTIKEASVYFGIGIKQLRRMAENNDGSYSLKFGNRFMICRPRFVIGQKQDSLYNDDRLRVDPDCFVGTIVLAVVIDRTVNGSSRFQFLQMLDQKVGLQRIRMIVVYRHSLLERDTILTAIVIVVV